MKTPSVKTILFINYSSVLYGAETRLIDVILHLDRSRFRPLVLLPQEGPLAGRLRETGIEPILLNFKLPMSRGWPLRFLDLNRRMLAILRKHRVDLIHINLHYFTWNLWLSFALARRPVIAHFRSHARTDFFERLVLSFYQRIIFVSDSVKRTFLETRGIGRFIRFRPQRLVRIYDGIDLEVFHRGAPEAGEAFRRHLGLRKKDILVGLVGAIDPIKGQDIFLHAAHLVHAKHPEVHFVLVGELYARHQRKIEYWNKITGLIQAYGLGHCFHMAGFRKDIPVVMNAIDVLCQPSAREALGTSMIEAMACGRPVIGTMTDGIPEVIGDNEAGLLLRRRNPFELAVHINHLLDHPQERQAMGQAGQRRAGTLFDIRKTIRELETIYTA